MGKQETGTGNGAKVVRIAFDITPEEAARLCALRYEPKPSTAAAQVVRMAVGGGAAGAGRTARVAGTGQGAAKAI